MLGLWGYVAAGIAAVFIIGGATHYVDSVYYNSTINSMKAKTASDDAARAAAVLKQFTDTANKINASAVSFHTTQADLGTKIDVISKDLENVQAKRPLPVGCKPDSDRLRNLNAAIAAANSATHP